MAVALKASPGTWVRVRLAGDAFPVQMQIGDAAAEPAFVDHVRERGNIAVYASRRCPQLRPGTYRVRVITPEGVLEQQLQVI